MNSDFRKWVCSAWALLVMCAAASAHAAERPAGEGKSDILYPQAELGSEPLTIDRAIDLVLRNNLTVRSARYDLIMSDTDYQKFQKKFTTTATLDGGYSHQEYPESGMTLFSGTKQYQWDANASLSKVFPWGTTVSAGVKEIYSDANDQAIEFMGATVKPEDPAYHKPSVFVNLQQELLKNAFGYGDRRQSEILKNATDMQRAAIVDMLSGLVVQTLADYWAMEVQDLARQNARIALDAVRQVRDIIVRNAQYGLSESYDANQYNALVAALEPRLEHAEQNYREAVRKFLRTLNVPPGTQVKGVTDLVDTLPPVDAAAAVKAGLDKRVDFRNALKDLENRQLDLGIQKNNSLPSLSLNLSGNTQGQREALADAVKNNYTGQYPGWLVRLKATYPLDDTEAKANLRNAYLRVKQSEIKVQNLRNEIRDEITSRSERVKVQHTALNKARVARSESEQYHRKILVKFRQGKTTSVAMRNALDTMIQAKQLELEALVLYNVTLLQFDLSKNEIFERYGVDVEKYIKMMKE